MQPDNVPLGLILYGIVNIVLEPLCYGCAAFVVTYRITKSVPAKILVILVSSLFFLWMDDIWPALAFRSAQMGMASENEFVGQMFEDNTQLGQAEFASGEQSGLWDIFDLDGWDIIACAIFVPLGFQIGLITTRRKWNELAASQVIPPPIPRAEGAPPPIP